MSDLVTTPSERAPRRRRSDGERSRAVILDAAAKLASVDGLDGLSIANLADHIGMSKSGLYAHFGSKEELQLTTIDVAKEIFVQEVIEPVSAETGAARLAALANAYFSYLERWVFPGGCFFAAVEPELDTHPGRVREKLREVSRSWLDYIELQVRGAQEMGELRRDEDAAQLAFELVAMFKMANAVFVLHDDETALERANQGVKTRLALAAS